MFKSPKSVYHVVTSCGVSRLCHYCTNRFTTIFSIQEAYLDQLEINIYLWLHNLMVLFSSHISVV